MGINAFEFGLQSEIEQESSLKPGDLEIIAHLFDVRLGQSFDALKFHKNSTFYDDVRPIDAYPDTVVVDIVCDLALESKLPLGQRHDKCVVVE